MSEVILQTLYGFEKSGKVKIWNAKVKKVNENLSISSISFGQLNGKQQLSERDYIEGKNIGKKNETSPYDQCLAETTKKWKDKQEKEGYKLKIENEKENKHYPMLANTFDPNKKKKNDIIFPCFVQPKIDGLRCIIYKEKDEIKTQSRSGTFFETLDHIKENLISFFKKFPNVILDGELYTTKMPFEELAGVIKKNKNKDIEKIKHVEYHIYDKIDLDLSFEKRFEWIYQNCQYKSICIVQTELIKDTNEFKKKFSEFVELGYEGIMLRNIDGKYRENYRSNDLQKYKEFVEDEYEIVGYKEGDGRDKGTVIWICQTKEDNKFSVRPRGTIENRKEFFKKGDKYIGKKLTVIYQELSEMNIPRFPVGKAIREDY
jgi:DNA ligase-1